MSHACTENQLVEQPAIGLFAALEETSGAGGTCACNLGRETRREGVLLPRLLVCQIEVEAT